MRPNSCFILFMVMNVKQSALPALASSERALTGQKPISDRAAKQVKNQVKPGTQNHRQTIVSIGFC